MRPDLFIVFVRYAIESTAEFIAGKTRGPMKSTES